jgi:hypothetical protein
MKMLGSCSDGIDWPAQPPLLPAAEAVLGWRSASGNAALRWPPFATCKAAPQARWNA